MNFKLIPPEERSKYRCCVCGETKSVKYLISTHNPLEGDRIYELPYCNKCALFAMNKEVKDDENMAR